MGPGFEPQPNHRRGIQRWVPLFCCHKVFQRTCHGLLSTDLVYLSFSAYGPSFVFKNFVLSGFEPQPNHRRGIQRWVPLFCCHKVCQRTCHGLLSADLVYLSFSAYGPSFVFKNFVLSGFEPQPRGNANSRRLKAGLERPAA